MQKKKIYKKNPDIVTRKIEEETILMPIYKSSKDIDSIYNLNPTAAQIWNLIDGKRSKAEIKKEIRKKYNVTEKKLDKEMKILFKDLKSIKAVI